MNLKIIAGISAGIFSTCGFCVVGLAAAWWVYRPAGVPHVAPVQAVGVPVAKPMVYLPGQAVDVEGVFVRVVSARIGQPVVTNLFGERTRGQVALNVELLIENRTKKYRIPESTWWAARATDEHGNTSKQMILEVGRLPKIDPGEQATEILHFDLPINAAKTVTIELYLDRLGKAGRKLKFRIDRDEFAAE